MPPTASKFILLGEDDLDDQELLKEVFATIDDSTRLTFVDSGKDALTLLEKLKDEQLPCLIVLDYNMPGLSGADILSELNGKTRYSHIPKIIWSTSGSENFRTRCLELGAADYVTKPTSVKELEEVVRYMLSVCSS
jgi:CheY-like chemotaxis protein